ncbi:mitochondrial folate carrier protein [Conidiobolus coronatus NRRL 28638]|uniref:Mitochondrial folate carrier protein n=1 Tax=Conidiobolus coronatus (strain ATCC 28846 / CBS 209.66 / NRRL 28638) TaxID=796925 RepID=A0A137NVX1_CONC2|nr:mitochondrial folate carrier protein [Conidiobolus coronatus NRRL 28638]|eukprot:KXN66953.1 mitochondrial folate carrier protein [Conidiobolus coronatus NRRL 28638]
MSKSVSGSPAIDQAIAGLTAGTVSTFILHPMDLVKTRLQANNKKLTLNSGLIGLSIGEVRRITSTNGVMGLYRGITPNLLGSSLSWALYFGFYSKIKQRYSSDLGDGRIATKMTKSEYMLASAQAGAMTTVFTNPIFVVKTRMLANDPTHPKAYSSFLNGIKSLYKLEGVRGLYRGFSAALIGTSHGAVQFLAYEQLKIWRWNLRNNRKLNQKPTDLETINAKLPTWEYLWMSSLSKTIAATLTYPYQVVKTRVQNYQSVSSVQYNGVIDTIGKIYKLEGLMGFYKGLAPSIVRVLPGTCITFEIMGM